MANAEVVFVKAFDKEQKIVSVITEAGEAQIPMGDLVDFGKEKERIQKELSNIESEISRAKNKLNNQGFLAKAPAQLIEEEKQKLVNFEELKQKLLARINEL